MATLHGINPFPYLANDSQKPGISSSTLAKAKKRKILTNSRQQYYVPISDRYSLLSNESDDENKDTMVIEKEVKSTKPPPIVLYSYINKHTKTVINIKQKLSCNIVIQNQGDRLVVNT